MAQYPFPYVELSGTHYEIGYQHGEFFKDTIHRIIKDNASTLIEQIENKAHNKVTEKELHEFSERYMPYAQEYCPEMMEEIRGIADGAGVSFEDIFFINCHLDMRDLTYPFLSQEMMLGCTTFGASCTATRNGESIIAQTYDWGDIFQCGSALLRIKAIGEPEVLVFTIAGMVGCAGMNSNGIALVINRLVAKDSKPGVPYPFIIRKALMQVRIGNGIYSVTNANRSSGLFYLVGDLNGEMIGIECSAKDYYVFYADNDYIAHTNHYVSARMQPYAVYSKPLAGDTIMRLSTANSRLANKCGDIVVEDIMELMRDHTGQPNSICRHSNEYASELSRSKTIAAIIMDLRTRRMWFAAGNACDTEFTVIDL